MLRESYNSSIKTLHVYRSLATTMGGPARSVPSLCRELSRQGYQATLLTCDPAKQNGSEDIGQTKIVVARFTNSELLSSLVAVHKTVSALADSIDIVHVHGVWPPICWVVGRWARKNR